MSYVNRDGYRIWYEEVGSGDPLVLLAGLGLDSGVWSKAVEELGDRYRCILIDNRGVGRSDRPSGPYTIDGMADDCAAVLDSLGLYDVRAVGWSMGGSILQSLLGRRTDLVSRAVLLSALPRYTAIQHAWLDGLLHLHSTPLEASVIAAFGAAWTFTPRSLSDHDQLWATSQLAAADADGKLREAFRSQAQGLRAYDSREILPSITAKVLVLAGAEDILTPPAQSIEIAEHIRGATLQILPRGSHAMILEYSADTLAAIVDFLK